MTPEQAAQLLDLVEDYAVCSDLRMYAWARRRHLQSEGAPTQAIEYARQVEALKTTFAEEALDGLRQHLDALVRGENPELRPADDHDVSEAVRARLAENGAAVLEAVAEFDIAPEALARTAAAGLVVSCWRDTIEPWHYLFSNAEMSWMSVVTTRDIAPYFDLNTNHIDVDDVVTVLTDTDREVLPETTAQDAFGPAWRTIASRVEQSIAKERSYGMTAATYVAHAGRICPKWWGCPRWASSAKEAARKLQLTRRQADVLATAPYELQFDVWERIIDVLQ